MSCSECNGTGRVVLLTNVVVCSQCVTLPILTFKLDNIRHGADESHWTQLEPMMRAIALKMARCPDCQGKGEYVGLHAREQCRLCNGTGQLEGREAALKSLFDKNMLSQMKTGTIIHVYDAGWYMAEVYAIDGDILRAGTICDAFDIPINGLTFNLTKSRWEYIKCGTPAWH